MTLLAVVVSAMVPAAGLAGEDKYYATVPGDLIAAADANRSQVFNVILQGRAATTAEVAGVVEAKQPNATDRKFRAIAGVSARLTGGSILGLRHNPNIFSITRDAPVSPTYVNAEMWRDSTDVDQLWSKEAVTCATDTLTGLKLDASCVPSPAVIAPQAPAIAIIDSGIDATRIADFGTRVVARANFSSGSPNAVGDDQGHGTMVAGVAAGASLKYPGVAQNAPLVDVRVADKDGRAFTSDVIAGIDWVLAVKDTYNIRVANLSLAGSSEASYLIDPLDRAVEKLWFAGVVVVAASGNHGAENHQVPMPSPGNDPFIITVGAVDQSGTSDPRDDTRAAWSAYGKTADGYTKPELVAPGRYMIMPVPMTATIPATKPERVVEPGYMWMSGTSFSAPAVAGAVAQLLARRPEMTPNQVKGALMASANKLKGPGTGVGELDADGAVAVSNPPNPNEGLMQFVKADPKANGLYFDQANWTEHVKSNSNWTLSNWTLSNWTEANWTASNWTSVNWTESNWTASNWTASNWTE